MEKNIKEKKKVIPMIAKEEPVELSAKEPKQYSYEELKSIASGMAEQIEKMRIQLLRYEEMLQIKRLDYLFAVLQNREGFSKKFLE
jgi:hypothetical protein